MESASTRKPHSHVGKKKRKEKKKEHIYNITAQDVRTEVRIITNVTLQ